MPAVNLRMVANADHYSLASTSSPFDMNTVCLICKHCVYTKCRKFEGVRSETGHKAVWLSRSCHWLEFDLVGPSRRSDQPDRWEKPGVRGVQPTGYSQQPPWWDLRSEWLLALMAAGSCMIGWPTRSY